MVVVAPEVDHAVLSERDVVNNAVEGHLSIDVEQCLVDAIVVIAALHVVVGPQCKANIAPRRERRCRPL